MRRENIVSAGIELQFRQERQEKTPSNGQQRGGNGGGGRHRSNGSGHYKGHWFPPLHSQSYWQQGGGRGDRGGSADGTPLPNLQGSSSSSQYQGRRGANNNHYHNNGEGRKYRGGQNKPPKPS